MLIQDKQKTLIQEHVLQLSFSRPAPRCLNSKCICAHLCAHGRAGLKTRCVQVHCWSVAILRQLK